MFEARGIVRITKEKKFFATIETERAKINSLKS